MYSQLYTAASGLIQEQKRLDLISNNLANLSTSGFRSQRLFSTIYRRLDPNVPESIQSGNASVAVAGAYEVPGRGPVRYTGRDLDVALADGTFLAVQAAGGRGYTRNGSLQITADGALLDGGGRSLLDAQGQSISGLGPLATIGADGAVREAGNELARLMLVRDPRNRLEITGEGLLSAGGRDNEMEAVGEPNLQPGWLEGSGTEALGELVQLIEAQRAFEAYQKMIFVTMNEVNRRAVNDLAG